MARKRAESMDQRSVWTVDAAGAPRKLRGSPMASPQPGGMLGFAPFRGFIRGMSVYLAHAGVVGTIGSDLRMDYTAVGRTRLRRGRACTTKVSSDALIRSRE